MNNRITGCLIVVWLVAVGFGLFLFERNRSVAGFLDPSPLNSPRDSNDLTKGKELLLLTFVHPHCSCTRATLSELARLMARTESKINAEVWFYLPEDADENWTSSELWEQARKIPGVQVFWDLDANEAKRYGARTSGQVIVYDRTGHLLFRGGITPSRGHEGDNPGRDAVWVLSQGGTPPRHQTAVYGCSIYASKN